MTEQSQHLSDMHDKNMEGENMNEKMEAEDIHEKMEAEEEDKYSEYTLGPDQVIPVNNSITWDPREPVKLKIETKSSESEFGPEFGSLAPQSIPGLLAQNATENPDVAALKARDSDKTELTWTWKEYHEDVRTVAKAFIDLGLGRFESVCILGFNSPEWVISDVAAIFAGGFAAGIYPTNGPEACKYILDHSKCVILVVEDQKQLDKVWHLRNDLPSIRKIVQYSGVPTDPSVLGWKDLLTLGRSLPDDLLEDRLSRIAVNQCCTLVYTSGTTGNPKGVMLSHDNITFQAKITTKKLKMDGGRILSYLPLSHIAGQLCDIHGTMATRSTTYFADNKCLRGTLVENLLWCKPTQFLGVPRVWEKIMEGMLAKGREIKGIKKMISTKAKEAGLRYHLHQAGNEMEYHLYKKIVYDNVKAALGLDECLGFYTGAAPMQKKTWEYFLSLDFKILEIYGMSETSGAHTLVTNESFLEKLYRDLASGRTSCGQPLCSSFKSKLVEPSNAGITDEKELCMWGRHIMMGYKNREDATKKEMTEDGWLKSGDLAKIDKGWISIVGRDKDLIITAGGENIPPAPIQDAIKKELPCVSQSLLLGDEQRFVSMFLTLTTDVNLETMEPTDSLSVATKDWCRSVGSEAETVQDVLEGPDRNVMAAIQDGIDRVNGRAVSNAQKIQKWTVIPKDFSLPGGELGPTMKVKRAEVTKKYKHCVDKIYSCTPSRA